MLKEKLLGGVDDDSAAVAPKGVLIDRSVSSESKTHDSPDSKLTVGQVEIDDAARTKRLIFLRFLYFLGGISSSTWGRYGGTFRVVSFLITYSPR